MDFDLTAEQEAFRDSVLAFATEVIEPGSEARNRGGAFDRELWRRCAAFGLAGLTVPEAFGGQGADTLTAVLALEALGEGCGDHGLIFSLNAHLWSAATPIARFGSPEQCDRYLPGLCDGSTIGVQAMSEPDAGSDAFSLTTRATPDGDGYRITGTKTWITNAPVADVFIVFATADPSKGWAGLSAFLVDADQPGVEVGAPIAKMGLATSPMGSVTFDDVRVPADRVLGKPGIGMAIFDHSMDWERSCILASGVGAMQRQLDASIGYARQREQFGQPIGRFQSVANRIVDMSVRVRAARLLLYEMAWKKDQGRKTPLETASVKLFVSESWVASSLDHLENHGAFGYSTESGVERGVRDALASRIYSGTSDIQRNLIARQLRL